MSIFFFILLVSARIAFLSPFMVEGQSMEPTLHNGEVFIIENSQEELERLQRGDIVVFSFDGEYFYVKRVIALPGETLRIGGNVVEIKKTGDGNYKRLNEPYLMGKNVNYGDERFFIVPEGHYFVMGDNRLHSKDSRTFVDPYVSQENIYGKYVYP